MKPELTRLQEDLLMVNHPDVYEYEELPTLGLQMTMPEMVYICEDLLASIEEYEVQEEEHVDRFFDLTCHLVLHRLCQVLDAVEEFDVSNSIRTVVISFLRFKADILEGNILPETDFVLRILEDLAEECETLEGMELCSSESIVSCALCLKFVCEVFETFGCHGVSDTIKDALELL